LKYNYHHAITLSKSVENSALIIDAILIFHQLPQCAVDLFQLQLVHSMWLPLKLLYSAISLVDNSLTSSETSEVDNSTARFIFNDVAFLLSQWPNTGHPNGHTLAFGEISTHTLLYHARKDTLEPPLPSPEWLAFDPEMSYAIEASRLPWGQPYLHTYRTKRPAKILYFNGMSAAWGEGWVDAQHVVVAGGKSKANATENLDWWDDFGRAQGLCKWAIPLGVDGILRMNAGLYVNMLDALSSTMFTLSFSEVIWCDFGSDALQLVSQLNVTPPGTSQDPPKWPPGRDIGLAPPPPGGRWPHFPEPAPLAVSGSMEWLRAASTRPFMPQPHVTLDYAQLVTFYHTKRTSLRSTYFLPMAEHRIWEHISDEDANDTLDELTCALDSKGSGYDWGLAAREMTYYWSSRIQQLDALLSNASYPPNITERV